MIIDNAKDVAAWIEHSNVSKMIDDAELDDSELIKKFIEITYSYGNGFRTRKQESLLLTVDGLYEVLMQSRKPVDKKIYVLLINILRFIVSIRIVA
ncbi:BRO family protein [Clostridium butyricum]|uniref:BRO family protein n=1 Tax=Clostridium butyricum TaxID=1492 RepID=UPI002AB035F0|nr:BRO family protein [Clostridium butyricum]